MTSPWLGAIIAIVSVTAAAVLGSIATMPNIETWYAGLSKPSFNPPNWIFGPVWSLLYAMMAYAFFRVLTSASSEWSGTAITLFLVQIALNAAWSWAFFAGHSPRGGLAVMVALWASVALTAFAFWQIDHVASILIWPYLGWVTFAAVLNLQIARLNLE